MQRRHRRTARVAVAVGLLGLAVLLAGCIDLGRGSSPTGTTRLQVVLDEAAQTRPLLSTAEQALIRRCMAAQGLDHPFSVPEFADVPAPSDGTLGLGARWEPARTGYRTGQAAIDPITAAYVASLADDERRRYERALLGSQTVAVGGGGDPAVEQQVGCLSEGRAVIRGQGEPVVADQFDDLDAQLGLLHTEVLGLIDADPDYRESVVAWQGCMTAAGYLGLDGQPLANPEDARDVALAVLWPEPGVAGADEMRMAMADRDCQDDADLPTKRFEAYLRLEGQVIDGADAQSLLATWESLSEAAVDAAIGVLEVEGLLPS